MTRRQALQLLSIYSGAMLQDRTTISTTYQLSAPLTLAFHLDGWKSITVQYRGEVVTIDPAEFFAALKEKP